jgi:hypothetical protein
MKRDEVQLVSALRRVGSPVCYTLPDWDEEQDPDMPFFLAGLTLEGELFQHQADHDGVLAMSGRVNAHDFDPRGIPFSG